jgi:hypothetical protein
MDEEPIAFLLGMFGVPVREFIPRQSTFVPVEHLTDREAAGMARENAGAAAFLRARVSGKLGPPSMPRPALFRALSGLSTVQGKAGHPNNPYVRAQALALKEKFGISLTRYEERLSACDYIAAAEAARWPAIQQRDMENLSRRRSAEGKRHLSGSDLQTKAVQIRATRINELIISMA